MWAALEVWRVQDGQLPELAVGDTWCTRFEVVLRDAEELASSTTLGMRLVEDPLTPTGPRYDFVARVTEDEASGHLLDAGEILVAPLTTATLHQGAVIHFRGELWGTERLYREPPDPLIRDWRVRQLFVR